MTCFFCVCGFNLLKNGLKFIRVHRFYYEHIFNFWTKIHIDIFVLVK